MASLASGNSGVNIILVIALLVLAFAGGYYYYQQKDKDTILDMNIGGKKITAEIEHE